MTKVVFAVESLSTVINGARFRVSKDEAFFDTDPVVKALPTKFVDVPVSLQRRQLADAARADVEDASAAPGTKRNTRRK